MGASVSLRIGAVTRGALAAYGHGMPQDWVCWWVAGMPVSHDSKRVREGRSSVSVRPHRMGLVSDCAPEGANFPTASHWMQAKPGEWDIGE